MMKGSGSVFPTNGSGSGRPKNIKTIRIRIRNQHCLLGSRSRGLLTLKAATPQIVKKMTDWCAGDSVASHGKRDGGDSSDLTRVHALHHRYLSYFFFLLPFWSRFHSCHKYWASWIISSGTPLYPSNFFYNLPVQRLLLLSYIWLLVLAETFTNSTSTCYLVYWVIVLGYF